jgi:hypothetical protein
MYTDFNADAVNSGFNGKFDWKTNAVTAYATMRF